MKIEKLAWEDALKAGERYPWMLIRALSSVTLGKSGDIAPAEDLIEAHFFSNEGEIRVFRSEDGLHAVRLAWEEGDSSVEERRVIENPSLGRYLTVRKLVDYDEDGQCIIKTVLPVKWEGGDANG